MQKMQCCLCDGATVVFLALQGDWQDVMPDFILKTYSSKGVTKKDIYYVDNKRKVAFYDDESD